jgi:hypothetical protein
MNSNLTEIKNQEDKWKNQYFESCKAIVETEKKIKNCEENEKSGGGGGSKTETAEYLNKLKTTLTKHKELKELRKKNYKEEQTKLNKLLEASESNYINIINSIEKEYGNKMNFIHNILKEINQTNSNFINEFTESIKKLESLHIDLNIKRDIRYFKQDYDFFIRSDNSKINKRFMLEEFLDYDYILTKSDIIDTNSLNIFNKNKDNDDNELNRAKTILDLGHSYFIDFSELSKKGKEINDIIINILNKESSIENIDFLLIINYIENNRENSNNFMELLVTHFCKNEFVVIKNEDNFQNLKGNYTKFCF